MNYEIYLNTFEKELNDIYEARDRFIKDNVITMVQHCGLISSKSIEETNAETVRIHFCKN